MDKLKVYLEAADRENTRRSYASAVRHFEVEWKGLLPATQHTIAQYLADYAGTLSSNTLRQRLAALSRWHTDYGFPDPTKSPLVRKVMRGIRTVHPAREKKAKPLQIEILQQVDSWLDQEAKGARARGDRAEELRHVRDRAILLLGFWRGFRADELVRLRIEHVKIEHGEGLSCSLPWSNGDQTIGRTFRCPALSRLCPVSALEDWLAMSSLTDGPVFRAIDRWGHLSGAGLATNSVIPMLRRIFDSAGIADLKAYSSHSLRRGFAGWANANGWDIKQLMEYVGLNDGTSGEGIKERFERGLSAAFGEAKEKEPSATDIRH